MVDGSPKDNVARNDGFGGASKATADAPKVGLSPTIPFVDRAIAGPVREVLRGVHQHHADQFDLIRDKIAHLRERPTIVAMPFAL